MDAHVIQNPDINVGPKAYKDLANDELLITSIFYTVQGEGPFAGHPAMFVRLAGCNRGRKTDMGCRFCDTAFQFALGKKMSFSEIEMEMQNKLAPRYNISTRPMVVITGGEPMMQKNLVRFIEFSQQADWGQIQIESNGDKLLPGLLVRDPKVTLVVSPKVSGGTYHEPNPDVYDRADFYKFVVEAVPGSPYYMPPSYADVHGCPVYVSPLTQYARPLAEGEVANAWNYRLIDTKQTSANYRHAAALALRYGYRLSMQQHLFFGVP